MAALNPTDKLATPTSGRDITQLLNRWQEGDANASDQLIILVYDTLRQMARQCLQGERADHTLQPTALVHEAYFRLIGHHEMSWKNREHFFAMAARTMRRILTDHARASLTEKRGGQVFTISLQDLSDISIEQPEYILSVHQALENLAKLDPEKARLVELRFFGGLSIEEIAQLMDSSRATVNRHWRLAKAWLYRELMNLEGDSTRTGD